MEKDTKVGVTIKTDEETVETARRLALEYGIKTGARVSQRRIVKAAMAVAADFPDQFRAVIEATK